MSGLKFKLYIWKQSVLYAYYSILIIDHTSIIKNQEADLPIYYKIITQLGIQFYNNLLKQKTGSGEGSS